MTYLTYWQIVLFSNPIYGQNILSFDYYFQEEDKGKYVLLEAEFLSPLVHHLPGLLPEESRIARFQMVLPKSWPDSRLRPTVLHLAGTGDHVSTFLFLI